MRDGFDWYKDKLEGEYLETFEQIELYGQVNVVASELYNDRMMELLDMFIEAAKDKVPVKNLVGDDIERFCKRCFSDDSVAGHIKDVWSKISGIAWILLIIEGLSFIDELRALQDMGQIWEIRSDLGIYIVSIIVSLTGLTIVTFVVRRFMFKLKWMNLNKYLGIYLGLYAVVLALSIVLASRLKVSVPSWIVILSTIVYLICFYIYSAIDNYKKYGKFIKDKPEKVDFLSKVDDNVEKLLPQKLKTRFEKKNQKLLRRGKQPISEAAFMAELRREVKLEKLLYFLAKVLLIFFWLERSYSYIFVKGDILLGVITSGVLAVIELAIYRALCSDVKERLIKKCDAKAMTIIEYADFINMS